MPNSDLNQTLELLAANEDKVTKIGESLTSASIEDLSLIRQSFVGHLGVEWGAILASNQPATTGSVLQRQVEQLDRFLTRFQNIVLAPRRSLLAQRLDQWLESWEVGKLVSLPYLQDANDGIMAELEEILDQAESPEMKDPVVHEVARQWLAYWLRQLREREKRASTIIEWLRHVDSGLYTAREYAQLFIFDQVIATIGETTQPLLRIIRDRWLQEHRAHLGNLDYKVDDLSFNELQELHEVTWSELQAALHTFAPALEDRSVSELMLIEQTIASWDVIAAPAIHELVNALSDVTRIQLRHANVMDNLSISVSEDLISDDVAALAAGPAIPPELSAASSFEQLVDAHIQLDSEIDNWEGKFRKVLGRVERDSHRWDRAPLPEELRSQIVMDDDILEDIQTLEQLAVVDAKVASANRLVRESIEQSLSAEEHALWEELNEHQASPGARVDLTAIESELSSDRFLTALWGLLQKGFIHIDVIL